MSEHHPRARLSRLDPANWPSGMGIVLFVAWVGYALVSAVWLHLLLWTVLPSGLMLYLYAERYPWRLILMFVAPLTLLTAFSQVVATRSDVSTSVAFAIYLVACGYFSVVVCSPNRDRWIAHFPGWLLGERFAARLAWTRFEESLLTANAVVRRVDASEDRGSRQAELHRLATDARREARRGGTWQDAWTAKATWLEGIGTVVGSDPSADQIQHVHDLLIALDAAHMRAVERTADI